TFHTAVSITAGGPDVTSGASSLFSAGPSIDSAGNLSFTPAADEWGTALVTVTLQDNGGTAFGGVDTSTSQTFFITVNLVNHVPSFTAGANQTVDENAGPQSVAGWATQVSAGPPSEANQNLTFIVTGDSNPSLFAAAPQISPSGTLTYTPATDVSGTATISVDLQDSGGTANGGKNTSAVQTFTIAVNFVNQPPTFVSAGNVTVLENSGPANQSKWATNISPGAPQEANQLLMFQLNTVSTPPGLFSVAPAIDSSGNLTFTPAANEFGTAQVAVTLVDDGREPDGSLGTPASSAPLTFTITVALVNHAPSFTAGGSQTVIENAGMQTAPGWATGMSAGPPSEAGQTLNFVLTPTNPALFSVPPAIDPATGNLTYTPAPDVSGQTLVSVQLHDSGGTANGGQDTSAPQTFGITINFVNQTPQFTAGADQTVHETPGPQTVPGWATGISPGAPQEQNQSLTFVVSTDNNALFSTPPAIDPITGNLTYTPAVYATGTAHVSVQLKDDGREPDGSFGPTAISPSQSFTITVTESNQAPVFTPGPDQVLSGSFSAITVPGWAANISPGPPNESGQALNFIVTNDNNTMFAVPPAIDTSGNLTFTPLPQTSGQADVTVRLHDNGGTANGGVDTSAPVTFLISITYVNQAPTFTAGANQAVLENAVISPVAGWATNINAGAADEASQQLNFLVSTDKPQLFSTPPAIDSSGNLTYTLAPNANGVANVNVQLHDNGGTANGGHDTSAPQTFTITIVPVNQPPLFTAGTNQTVLENPGTVTVKGWASGISPGVANEASQTLNFLVSTDNPTLFPTPPTIDPATGNLSFTPAFDEVGTATVSVQLHDNGGTANGGQDTSAAQSFTITVLPVNQPPVVTLGANQVVNENSGARTVSGWATNIGPGGPNEIGQQLNFLVSSDNPGLFTVPPQIDVATGNLTYTVAPFTSGTAHVSVQLHDNGGTANGGRDTSTPQVFTITVNFVNEAPSFTLPGTSPTVNENSGNATFWNFATQISPSSGYPPAPNEGSQTVHFNASNNNPGLFSAQPTIDPAGNLRFTSAPNASGTATVTAALQDNGGTANGGQDTSAAQQFTITVNFVNQAPTITSLGANVVANEDSGQVSMANFVSTASPPGPNAAPQQITYLVTPLNPNLFTTAGQPAIGADGMLTFTPGLHAVGSTSVTVQAQNSAGTAYGGNDLSTPSKFFIQIQQIDHAPTVANPLADVTVNESARAFDQVIGNLANVFDDIDIDLGLGDFLTLSISGDSNPSLVTASLSDADPATSQLDLHFLAGQYGAAVINLRATDQAGKYVDDPLNITVNQTVVAFDHSYVLSLGAASAVNATQGVLTGDSAPGGLPLSATLVSQAAFGTVTLHADGSFTYAKGPNFAGIDSFTYQATDGSGTSNVATVNITSFEATMVTKLYQQVLHRAPDTAGLQFWVNQVQQGKPYGAVAQGIFQSPERLDPIIESYYHQFLNRPADSAGLTYWYGVWVAHGGPEPVVAGMISSPEFYSLAQQAYAGLSPSTAWVTALYHRLLNRAPDPAGLTYWTGLIDSGTLGLSQVVNDFNISPEYYQNLTVGFFNQYLGRAPTTDELQHYVGLFEQGASQSDLQIQIINSPAYSNSPPPPVAGTMRMLS
ncbi:MAG TPA: Ig-like domain-containing protein, partial [Pirellulales bacterium]